MLSTKFGQDNSGGFRDNAENVQILTDNAGCSKNNEGKKTPDSHIGHQIDSLYLKINVFFAKVGLKLFDDVFLLRTVFGIYPINTRFSTSHICR